MNTVISELNKKINIENLKWIPRWRINNGKEDSFVVPFATTHPINIVYHGENEFDYGQYGIHLGQQDSLTFLGNSDTIITAKFIDLRKNSPTFKNTLEFTFSPSTQKTLTIPPGVAHTFYNLGNIYTINDYKLYLPPIEDIIKVNIPWSPENDIINLPEDTELSTVDGFIPMSCEASDAVYDRIANYQKENIKKITYQHQETRTFKMSDGNAVTVMLRKKIRKKKVNHCHHQILQVFTSMNYLV